MTSTTVLSVSSRALLAYCDKLGVDSSAILAEVGLTRSVIDDPDARLPRERVSVLWRRAYELSGDPDLSLHAAEALPFGAYRVIDYLGANASSVGVALAHVAAYFPIINSAVRLTIAEHRDEIVMGITSPSDPAVLTRPYVEYALAAIFLRVRAGTNVRFPLRAIEFAFPQPPSIAEHERVFECEVRFGAAESRMRMSRATCELRNERADPHLFGILTDHARILERAIASETEPLRDVRKAIAEQLTGGPPSLERVAKRLAMSPRTLQRRLADHGQRYADLLDSTRAGAAKSYLSDRHLSVAEVAYLLGFAEQSSFTRAFKRWTGVAPNEYRKGA